MLTPDLGKIEVPLPRIRLRWIVIALSFYILSYCFASHNGGYVTTMSGERRWPMTGFAVYDIAIWKPIGVEWEIYVDIRGERSLRAFNLLGLVYAPLVAIDRKWFHPTIDAWKPIDGRSVVD